MVRRMADLLVLVRHGESTWNAEHRLQGQQDPPLSARGREQARAAARVVAGLGLPAARIVCSDLSRARETAELLGLGAARLDPAWREIDVGRWAGRRAAEVHGGCVRAATAHLTGADARALGAPGNGSATVFALGARPRLLAYGIGPDGALRSGLY